LKNGDTVTKKALKPDGICYRWGPAIVEGMTSDSVVVVSPVGHEVHALNGGWVSEVAVRTYYWLDRPYNLLEVYKADGNLQELYVHVASLPRMYQTEIQYIDYELDVVRRPGNDPFITDEDEFAEAVKKYNLSDKLQQTCEQASIEALSLLREWNPGDIPVFG